VSSPTDHEEADLFQSQGAEGAEAPADKDVLPLTETTNQNKTEKTEKTDKSEKSEKSDKKGANTNPREPRERRERGPPADGIPSKTKVMVANLPYDLSEDQVRLQKRHLILSPC
jgi:hypothetical protein